MSSSDQNLEQINNIHDLGSHSVIAKDNAFSGEFRADGLLRIDGDFKGVIKGYGTVLVGQNGRILGDVYARSIRIGGKIKGSVFALEKVEILSTGKLLGDLCSPRFLAEEGMIFTGKGKTISKNEIDLLFEQNVKKIRPLIEVDF